MMARSSLLNRGACLIASCVLLFVGAPAIGDSLAAIPPAGEERARSTFSDFVDTWMAKLEAVEARNRENPTVQSGASQSPMTYRGFGEDITTELHPTGHPAAPYIGILRYSERTHSCSDAETTNCSVASTVPVTEIFRYQGGRWIY